jgi:MFS family permease
VRTALVFVSSAAVLVLEILGIRLLAPYVGLTLETTTAIIGTVLAGIAAGAALGGRAADRFDPARLLPALLIGGGVLAMLTVPLVRGLGGALRNGGDAAAIVVALVALFPAATVLSAVTPAVAKLELHDLRATGSVVGRISAWATAGALVGTFATGFVIVPLLPTDVAVLAVGALLVALGTATARRAVAAAAAVAALVAGGATAAVPVPCDAETDYHCARVEVDARGGRILVLEDLRHSYVDLRHPEHLEFPYTRWIGDAIDGAAPSGAALDAVFLGGGGFTLPRYLAATRPGSRSRVLEVDGDLVRLARTRLGLRTGAGLRVHVGDARVTLRGEPGASADVVVGDAFGGRSLPWHLATVEFAREVRRVLRPHGVYALNVIDHGPLRLLRAETATLRMVFRGVAVVSAPGSGNFVLVASDGPLPAGVGSPQRAAELAAGADPLRDDDAPADQLLTPSA